MHARDGFIIQRAAATPQQEIVAVSTEHLSSPRGRAGFRYLDEMPSGSMVPDNYRWTFEQSLLEAFLITLLSELNRPAAGDASRSPLVVEAEKLARTLLPDPELVGGTSGTFAGMLSRLSLSAFPRRARHDPDSMDHPRADGHSKGSAGRSTTQCRRDLLGLRLQRAFLFHSRFPTAHRHHATRVPDDRNLA